MTPPSTGGPGRRRGAWEAARVCMGPWQGSQPMQAGGGAGTGWMYGNCARQAPGPRGGLWLPYALRRALSTENKLALNIGLFLVVMDLPPSPAQMVLLNSGSETSSNLARVTQPWSNISSPALKTVLLYTCN